MYCISGQLELPTGFRYYYYYYYWGYYGIGGYF
jgi:hypothetical protein